ncbi:hypothetical protein TNCV_379061 [Trichonephila clavipes]|nr:hypothetical protein TNCV_379061 [Trichonephila clavipes]
MLISRTLPTEDILGRQATTRELCSMVTMVVRTSTFIIAEVTSKFVTFPNASQKAYGAFLRVKHKDRVNVDLVTSKSRVAPLKRLSLPRLELMGAVHD